MYGPIGPIPRLAALYAKQGKTTPGTKDRIYDRIKEYGIDVDKEIFDKDIWPGVMVFVALSAADDLLREELQLVMRTPGMQLTPPGKG